MKHDSPTGLVGKANSDNSDTGITCEKNGEEGTWSNSTCSSHHVICLPDIGKKFASKEEYAQLLKKHISNNNQEQQDLIASSDNDTDEETTNAPGKIKVVKSLQELCKNDFNSKQELFVSQEEIFILQDESVPLFETSQQFGHPSDVHTHLFEIHGNNEKENTTHHSSRRISSLNICVVYQGQFCQENYMPSIVVVRLQEKQKIVPLEKEQSPKNSSCKIKNVGHAPSRLQVLNTSKHLGRAVIKYQLLHPIENGQFQVVIWMKKSASKYSILVSGKVMYQARDFVRQEVCIFFSNKEKIKSHELVVDNFRLDIRSKKKRIELLESSIKDIDKDRKQCELNINDCELKLENDDNVDFLLENDNILKLERHYARKCHLISVRRTSIDKAKSDILETRENIRVEDEVLQALRRANEVLLNMLPIAVNRVLGNRQYILLTTAMKLLNVPNKKKKGRKSWRKGFISTQNRGEHINCDSGYIEERNKPMTSQERSRLLIREIDRVNDYPDELVPSTVLHTLPQLFPRNELLTDIERELRKNITEDVRQEDSKNSYLQKVISGENDDDSSCDTLDFEKDDTTLPRHFENKDIIEIDCQAIDESSDCRNNPNLRSSIIDETHFEERRGTLTNKILSMKKGDSTYVEDDMQELLREAQGIDKTLKLVRIENELYDAYATKTGFIVVRALHGYDTMMRTEEAIHALETEHDRLVAFFVSEELIEDSLKWMYNGWLFGEVFSTDESAITPPDKLEIVSISAKNDSKKLFGNAISHQIETNTNERNHISKKILDDAEKNMKVGLFCIVLRYFDVINRVKIEKKCLVDETEMTGDKKVIKGTHERIRMNKEEQNATRRESLASCYYEKAKRGEARKLLRSKMDRTKMFNLSRQKYQKVTLEQASVLVLQRYYRGHIGRKAARRWKYKYQDILALYALSNASAITITRIWRGFLARQEASLLRKQMAAYILELREADLREEEAERALQNKRMWHRKKS